jgi:hypothetical protein
MTARDPRRRGHRYDGAIGQRELVQWLIGGIRVLAVPTVALSLLLAVDAVLPGTVETGISYRRAVASHWLSPDGMKVSLGWPNRPDCLEQRGDSGRRLLFTTRPGCAGTVTVGFDFGARLAGNDTLRVVRTPVFGQVQAVHRPTDGTSDRHPLWDLGLTVIIGLVPLLSFGRTFGVYAGTDDAPRYHVVYLLPALGAEALYAWLLLQALSG